MAENGGPEVLTSPQGLHGQPLAVSVPLDINQLRRHDPPLAARWRGAVRDAMGGAMERGYQATGMRRDGTYLLTQARPAARTEGTHA